MSDYGVKVSLPGKDVTEAGLKDLLFHSKYPLLKLKQSGGGSVTFTDGANNGFDEVIYTHNLGYKPIFFLFSQYYDGFTASLVTDFIRMPINARSAGGVLITRYTPYVTDTELHYSGLTNGGDEGQHTINFYWFLYYDPE